MTTHSKGIEHIFSWQAGYAKVLWLLLGVSLVGGVAFWYYTQEEILETAIVERHDLVQEVSISGAVKPSTELDLAFEAGGKLSSVTVKVGDSVRTGQVLARLNNASLLAQRAQAQASFESAQAQLKQSQAAASRERVVLEELQEGSTKEEIAVKQSKLDSAIKSQSDARIQFSSALYSIFLIADNAIRNDADTVIDNPRTNPRLLFPTEYDITQTVEQERSEIETMLKVWQSGLVAEVPHEDIPEFEADTRSRLGAILVFLDNLNYALNVADPSVRASQDTLDTWSEMISASRSAVVAAVTTLSTAYATVAQADSAVDLAQRELEVTLSGVSEQQLSIQSLRVQEADIAVQNYQAQVQKAQADIQYINANLSQIVMYAPRDGVIVKRHVQVGEVISPREVIFELVSDSTNEIEVYVPEADIAKISVGNSATVEFDAYPNREPVSAHVIFIDPASTETEGLSTYRVLIELDEVDGLAVKPGMTIDATIITDTREAVLAVPLRATRLEDDQVFIQIVDTAQQIEKRPIQLGLRGNTGLVEVTEGLTEGEQYLPVF